MTRRQTTGLLIASSLLPYAALGQSNGTNSEDLKLAERLGRVLNDKLKPDCQGTFSVLAFQQGRVRGVPAMATLVQLDWPPGIRRRLIRSGGRTEEAAFQAVIDNSIRTFARSGPTCLT
ncbi:hypothetical protein N9L47_01360 [Rhodobacteraceae bacterium]|nr:hypothetical protein [Paracoccaceae bacterium]